jgi:uncharacterized protein
VHQDGLVHISALTNKFISDPREVVKAGDIVKVKVLEVDVPRKRISFTMRLDDTPNQASGSADKGPRAGKGSNKGPNKGQGKQSGQQRGGQSRSNQVQNSAMGNAFADAFAKAKK